MIECHDFSKDTEQAIINYAFEYVTHNSGEVRSQVYLSLLSLYLKIKGKIRNYFANLKSQQVEILENAIQLTEKGDLEAAREFIMDSQ